MTQNQGTPTINMERFVTLSVQMLDTYFFKETKHKARKLFKDIESGRVVGVASVGVKEDKNVKIKVKLQLDHSDFQGLLTFHLFRQALDVMLKNLAARLRAKKDLNVYTSEETGEVVFNVPGLVEDRGNVNVLMMGLLAQEGQVIIRLQFFDPEQFKKSDESEETASDDNSQGESTL